VKAFLNRLGLTFYWVFFFVSILIVLASVKLLLMGTEHSWLMLFFSIITYFLGFGLRYLLSGKTDHFIFHYMKRLFKK